MVHGSAALPQSCDECVVVGRIESRKSLLKRRKRTPEAGKVRRQSVRCFATAWSLDSSVNVVQTQPFLSNTGVFRRSRQAWLNKVGGVIFNQVAKGEI